MKRLLMMAAAVLLCHAEASTPLGETNSLALANAGTVFPLTVANGDLKWSSGLILAGAIYMGGGGSNTLTISGGVMQLSQEQVPSNLPHLLLGDPTYGGGVCYGSVLTNGLLTVTNAAHSGQIAVERGVLTIQGGTVIADVFSLTNGGSFTSTVNVYGGTLNVLSGPIVVGATSAGKMTISGGTVTAQTVRLGGASPSASGFLHLTGRGNLNVVGIAGCETCGFTINDCQQDGGGLNAATASVVIGQGHNAQYGLSGGTAICSNMYVGYSPGFTGTFTQSGGTFVVLNKFIIGDCAGNALGVPNFSGGTIFVTNASHSAAMDVRNGTFTLGPGCTLVVDTLIVTNSCGHFVKNGGALKARNIIQNESERGR